METFMLIVICVVAFLLMIGLIKLTGEPMFLQGYVWRYFICLAAVLMLIEVLGGVMSSIFSFLGWLLPKLIIVIVIICVLLYFANKDDNGNGGGS